MPCLRICLQYRTVEAEAGDGSTEGKEQATGGTGEGNEWDEGTEGSVRGVQMSSDFDTIQQVLETAQSDAQELGGEYSKRYVKKALDALERIKGRLDAMIEAEAENARV
jgi:hypothetical protein